MLVHGYMIPMKTVDDRFVDKTHEDCDEREEIMISKNTKAKNYLIYGLARNIYIKVLIKHLVLMKCE